VKDNEVVIIHGGSFHIVDFRARSSAIGECRNVHRQNDRVVQLPKVLTWLLSWIGFCLSATKEKVRGVLELITCESRTRERGNASGVVL
jgi:hypothetical protein